MNRDRVVEIQARGPNQLKPRPMNVARSAVPAMRPRPRPSRNPALRRPSRLWASLAVSATPLQQSNRSSLAHQLTCLQRRRGRGHTLQTAASNNKTREAAADRERRERRRRDQLRSSARMSQRRVLSLDLEETHECSQTKEQRAS